jgi:opacity protein-like surface antigen
MKPDNKMNKNGFANRNVPLLLAAAILAVASQSAAADFSFKPSITVSEEYTDNVFLTSAAPKSDYITRVLPGFTSKYNAPFWEWDISYAFDFRYYANQSRKNDNTQQVAAKGLIKLVDERLFLELSDTYKRVSLDSVRDTTTESLSIQQTDSNTAVISPYVMLRPTAATSVKTGYRYINTLYKDPSAVDSISHIGFMESSYEVAPKLSINLEYSFTRQESDLQQFNRHDAYLGSRYEYADKSFIFGMGGVSLVRYNNGVNTNNPIWKGGITHTFDTVVASLSTDVKYTDNAQGAPNLTKTYSASLNKTFARGTFTVNGSYSDYSATDNVAVLTPTSLTTAAVNQDRKSYVAGFSSKYELLAKLNGTLGLTYNHITNEQQKSITRQYQVNSGLDYTFADELTASLTYSYSDTSSAQIAADNRKVNRVTLEIKKVF